MKLRPAKFQEPLALNPGREPGIPSASSKLMPPPIGPPGVRFSWNVTFVWNQAYWPPMSRRNVSGTSPGNCFEDSATAKEAAASRRAAETSARGAFPFDETDRTDSRKCAMKFSPPQTGGGCVDTSHQIMGALPPGNRAVAAAGGQGIATQ